MKTTWPQRYLWCFFYGFGVVAYHHKKKNAEVFELLYTEETLKRNQDDIKILDTDINEVRKISNYVTDYKEVN